MAEDGAVDEPPSKRLKTSHSADAEGEETLPLSTAENPSTDQGRYREAPYPAADPLPEETSLNVKDVNRSTVARDVLHAAGIHPDAKEKPLNHEFFPFVGHFLNWNSDLSTIDHSVHKQARLNKVALDYQQKMIEQASKETTAPYKSRYICNVHRCATGTNAKRDLSKHFKDKTGPHDIKAYDVKKMIEVDWADWLRDDGLNASMGATTKAEFDAILDGDDDGDVDMGNA